VTTDHEILGSSPRRDFFFNEEHDSGAYTEGCRRGRCLKLKDLTVVAHPRNDMIAARYDIMFLVTDTCKYLRLAILDPPKPVMVRKVQEEARAVIAHMEVVPAHAYCTRQLRLSLAAVGGRGAAFTELTVVDRLDRLIEVQHPGPGRGRCRP
jgi:hypothetical protein